MIICKRYVSGKYQLQCADCYTDLDQVDYQTITWLVNNQETPKCHKCDNRSDGVPEVLLPENGNTDDVWHFAIGDKKLWVTAPPELPF